jgi:hypothetical protein
MHGMLFTTINDNPAQRNLSGQSKRKGAPCPHCLEDTCAIWLRHSKKYVFMGHRRIAADGPLVIWVRPTVVRRGTSRRIGTSVAWGKREPRDGTRTAGRRPALARVYGGARRRALERESAAGANAC